jgi:hypothetical protein
MFADSHTKSNISLLLLFSFHFSLDLAFIFIFNKEFWEKILQWSKHRLAICAEAAPFTLGRIPLSFETFRGRGGTDDGPLQKKILQGAEKVL